MWAWIWFGLFVTVSLAYSTVATERDKLFKMNGRLINEYNKLVEAYNTKGGQRIVVRQGSVDPALLDKLIRFCHPDKHGNSERAKDITQRLLQLRG